MPALGWLPSADLPPPGHLIPSNQLVLRQFMMGPATTGAAPHFHGHALNLLPHGRKRWLLWRPARAFFALESVRRWLGNDYEEEDLGV